MRPYFGLLAYYFFMLVLPEWNWRWSISPFPFQKYIFVMMMVGMLTTSFRGNVIRGVPLLGCFSLVAFLGWAYLSATQTVDTRPTEFWMGVMWKLVLVSVIAVILLDSEDKIIGLLWVSIIAQGYNAYRINDDYLAMGYCKWAYDGWASLDNNTYSILTVPLLACSLALAMGSKKKWHQGVAGLIFLMQMHQIMLLQSRGCMIGGLVQAMFYVLFMPKTKKNLTIVVLAFLAGAALAGPSVVEEFSSSFESEGELDSSADSRYKLWKAGFEITRDYPILGVGPFAGARMVPKYIPEYAGLYNKGLHNLFFEVSCGVGVPGVCFYLGFWVVGWLGVASIYVRNRKKLTDKGKMIALAVLSGLPGYFISSMFSSGALLESSYLLGVVALAWIAVFDRDRPMQGDTGTERTRAPSSIWAEVAPGYIPPGSTGHGATGHASIPPSHAPPGQSPYSPAPPGSYPPGSYPAGSYPPGSYPAQAGGPVSVSPGSVPLGAGTAPSRHSDSQSHGWAQTPR